MLKDPKVRQVEQVRLEHKEDHKVLKEGLVLREFKEHKVLKEDHKVLKGPQDHKVHKEYKVLKVPHKGHKEYKVLKDL